MVKSTTRNKGIISRYRLELIKHGISEISAYLYGSYARGSAHEGSDIALIIVSDDFKGMSIRERLELLGLVSATLMEPIQAYGLTSEELEKHDLDPFWTNILKFEAVPV